MLKYSVLLSVYAKDKPLYLEQALESIVRQEYMPAQIVLVEDGPLTQELEQIVKRYEQQFSGLFEVLRLAQNRGLGEALNQGLAKCSEELVARMDSDDISLPLRCQKQVAYFSEHPQVGILSSTVAEFADDIENTVGRRTLPLSYEEVLKSSKRRNPFNHPAVMFRKSAVEAAGGYQQTYPLFEDYYLWVRMLQNGVIGVNLQDSLLNMRVSEQLYKRRGGTQYAKNLLKFRSWMKKSGWITSLDFCFTALPHAFVAMLPNGLRKLIYRQILHK